MINIDFNYIGIFSISSWILSILIIWFKNKTLKKISIALVYIGLTSLILFIAILWYNIGRPPMRTLGETRLLYSTLIPIVGIVTFHRWGYKLFLIICLFFAMLFISINLSSPENFSKELMPALNSPWFVPHVIVYIIAYVLLGGSCIVAIIALISTSIFKNIFKFDLIILADNLVYLGFSFLTLGLIFGALWAREAWGSYWTWDPKETWALLTWLMYLTYIHFRHKHPKKQTLALWTLALAFVVLLICWFGLNYLPSAQYSVHTYSS